MSNEQNENKTERRPFAPGLCFSKLVWVFLISCVVGFLLETLWCYIRHGYIESRQSLVYGPLSVAAQDLCKLRQYRPAKARK